MTETPFFFPNDEHRLFGILHQPAAPNRQGFVFCHPFAEEKLWAHRVFVNYARILCDAGYTVLRFDFMGHGDSSGRFEESTVESRLADIACAVRTLSTEAGRLGRIGLLGLRFGATLAALAADRDHQLKPLVLWEPIDKGAQHMKELIRINLSTQTAVYKEIRENTETLVARMKEGGTINIDGYEIRHPLYEQMTAIALSERKSDYSGPVLAVQVNKSKGMGIKRIDKLAARYPSAQVRDVVEQPFWKEIREYYALAPNLFTETTQWIIQNG